MRSSPPDPPLYNSRIIDTYLRLLQLSYPGVDIRVLLDAAGMQPCQVADPGHWFTQEQVDRFYDKLLELTKNPDIAREAGRYAASADALGPFRQYLLAMLGPAGAFALISKTASRLTRSASYSSRRLGGRKVEVSVHPHDGVEEKEFQCANRLGWFEAAIRIFDLEMDAIEHPQCLFRGDPVCRYIVSWKRASASPWRTFRNAALLILAPVWMAALLFSPSLALFLGGGMVFSLLGFVSEAEDKARLKKKVAHLRKDTEEAFNTISRNYDNALLTDEIGRTISQETHLEGVLRRVVELISERMDFDRVMIFLPNREQTLLKLHVEYGFSSENRDLLRDFTIPIDSDHRHWLVANTFWEQRPILIGDPEDWRESFSTEGFRLIRELGAESFLCCPIVCNGISLGILAADKKAKHRPLTQTDLSLMDGVAAYIGIALRNADLLEGMATQLRQIQEKDEELAKYREELEDKVRTRTLQLQEALRAAEAASRAKSDFLANMSHEIRTPLHGIIGLNELLLESGLNSQQLQLTHQIQLGAESLLEIITDILDFSKIEANKIVLEAIDFNLEDLLHAVLDLFRPQAQAKRLDLALALTSPLNFPLWIQGDPCRLRQVLNNLVGNALKFTETGGVVIRLGMSFLGGRSMLHVEVTDSGIGIAEEQKQKIFESFSQGDGSTSRRYGGTGLGTSIAKNLVELMGGRIGCESVPGKGSTFWFDLPVKPGHAPEAPEEKAERTAGEAGSLRAGAILVVEDVPVNREILKGHLTKAGYRVALAENGVEALKTLRERAFDLIVMDIQMPEMNGLEATRRIRGAEAGDDRRAIPILAMTADATVACRRACLEAGVDGILTKPVRKREILQAVDARLSQRSLPAPPLGGRESREPLALEDALLEFGLDMETFREVFNIFLRDSEENLRRLDRTHREGDHAALRQLAHGFRGSAGQLFAWPLYRSLESLEEAVEESDTEKVGMRLLNVSRELRRLQDHWRLAPGFQGLVNSGEDMPR